MNSIEKETPKYAAYSLAGNNMHNYQYLTVLLHLIVVSKGLPVNVPFERNSVVDTASDAHINTTQIVILPL